MTLSSPRASYRHLHLFIESAFYDLGQAEVPALPRLHEKTLAGRRFQKRERERHGAFSGISFHIPPIASILLNLCPIEETSPI